MTDARRIESERCLFEFPHPSTGAGYVEREEAYEARRHELSAAVDCWFANAPGSRAIRRSPAPPVVVLSRDECESIDDELWDKVSRMALDLLRGTWKASSSGRDVLNRVCEARGTLDLLGYWGISDAAARQAVGQPGRLPPEIAAAMGVDRAAQFAGGHPRPKALLALATALSEHTRRRR